MYGSTRAFAGLQSALDVIAEKPPPASVRLGVLKVLPSRLLAVVLVLATGVVIVAGMALETLGSTLGGLLSDYLPRGSVVEVFGYRIVSILLRTCCLAAVYRVLPWHRPSWRVVWPAGLLAAVLLSLGHSLIGWYITYLGVKSAYGAAGSVIALLFSFYYVASVVLFGAQFGKAYSSK